MRKKLNATQIYFIYSGVSALLFIMMKNVREIYRIDVAELNAFYLIFVGTTLEISHLIFEIPTGIIADRVSRKLSIVIGLILIGVSLLLEGFFPILGIIIFGQVILGLGDTFTSGADEAWIADEVGHEKLEYILLKGTQIGLLLSIIGIIISMVLGSVAISLPYVFGGGVFILLSLFLMVFMKETGHEKMEAHSQNSFKHMMITMKVVSGFIKQKPVLMLMVFVSLIYGLYSEGFDRLWTAHIFEDTVVPSVFNRVVWVSIINLSAMIPSILAVEYMKRKLVKTGKLQKVWILLVINMFMVGSLFAFALAGDFAIAVSLYMTFYLVRRINRPVYRAWMNQHIDSKIRATVLSTFGQLDSIGQIVGGLIIGAIAVSTSITTGIMVSALILSPVIIIFLLFIKKIKHNGELDY